MKRKIILIILILILGFLAWRLFVKTFSTGPIEIIVENKQEISSENLDNAKERSIDHTIESSIEDSTKTTVEKPVPKTKTQSTQVAKENDPFIINKKVSWGYSTSNGRTIDTIVLHSSYDALGSKPYDLDGLIKEYQQYGVAPHFLIDREGSVYQLVDEKNIAYHAGVSKTPDGRTGVNNFSIGIELMNTKEDNYTENQYSSLNTLIDYLENQYPIKYVIGHDTIAPDRKTDPWNMEWERITSKHKIHD